jgi:glutaredoxin
MAKKLYTQPDCPFCPESKKIISKQFSGYEEIKVITKQEREAALKEGVTYTPYVIDELGKECKIKKNKKGEHYYECSSYRFLRD